MKRPYQYLLGVWLLLGVLLAGLTVGHPTHATSPDSLHYLRIATSWRTYGGVFPPGYSILIGLVATGSSLPVLWASKLLNWLLLGLFGWLWAGRVGPGQAAGLLAVWGLPGNLRIAAYTWSETLFCVLLIEALWCWHQARLKSMQSGALRLAGLLVALVWVRYVGLFLIGWVLWPGRGLGGWSWPSRRCRLLIGGCLLGLLPLFILNGYLTAQLVGGTRLLPTEPWSELVRMAGVAVLNEVLLYNYHAGGPLSLFYGAMLVQTVVVAGACYRFRHRAIGKIPPATKQLLQLLFRAGLIYFLILLALRVLSPFDALNERLLLPGSFCWQLALIGWIQSQHSMIRRSPKRAEMLTKPS